MDKFGFEGSLVLEKLAEIGKIEEFFDAIDSDDLSQVRSLMKLTGINHETISNILKAILNR